MTKIVKKRLRLKKKPLIIFLLCITLIVISITNGFNKKEKTTTLKKVLTNKEIKLDKLKNIDKKLDYFNYDYIDRYIDYKNKNKNLSLEDVITHVNIGIDNDYYTTYNNHQITAVDIHEENLDSDKIISYKLIDNGEVKMQNKK